MSGEHTPKRRKQWSARALRRHPERFNEVASFDGPLLQKWLHVTLNDSDVLSELCTPEKSQPRDST